MPSDGRSPLAVTQFCLNKKEKLPTTRISEGLSVWLNNISPLLMGDCTNGRWHGIKP